MTEERESVKGVSTVTDDEILQAAAKLGPRVAVPELADHFGYSHTGMRDRVRSLRESGDLHLDYHHHNMKLYTVPDDVAESVAERRHRTTRATVPNITDAVENGDVTLEDLQQGFGDVLRLIEAAEELQPEDLVDTPEPESDESDAPDQPGPITASEMIDGIESGEIEISELASAFDDITRLLQVCRNSLDDDQMKELAEELGMSALIARSPSSFFRNLRNHIEGRRGRMGTNSRSVDSASVR